MNGKHSILSTATFGQRVAEQEQEELEKYFVETEQWNDIFSGKIDVIYGPKGSGKSALYSLLLLRGEALFDRGIIAVPAENLRGAPAFKDLIDDDKPKSEREFLAIWKLFFLSLIGDQLLEFGATSKEAAVVLTALREAGLVRHEGLSAKLAAVMRYLRGFLSPNSISAGMNFDAFTGMPSGFGAKITIRDTTAEEQLDGRRSLDQLLKMCDQALVELGMSTWLLLDRLDVAFKDDRELEFNALRALFHAYLDLQGLTNVKLKIFLRSDIWKKLVSSGFREASHVTRERTITWDSSSLLNLVIRRLIQNPKICEYYRVNENAVLSSFRAQRDLFYRVFPEWVDKGRDAVKTFDWILLRTKDGTGENTPRELIHLFNEAREHQIKKFEVGDREPEGERLFVPKVFADVFPTISKSRLEKTFLAEYPLLRYYVERLTGQRASQSPESLAPIWRTTHDETLRIAAELYDAGFFERQGGVVTPTYIVPHVYRAALDMG